HRLAEQLRLVEGAARLGRVRRDRSLHRCLPSTNIVGLNLIYKHPPATVLVSSAPGNSPVPSSGAWFGQNSARPLKSSPRNRTQTRVPPCKTTLASLLLRRMQKRPRKRISFSSE